MKLKKERTVCIMNKKKLLYELLRVTIFIILVILLVVALALIPNVVRIITAIIGGWQIGDWLGEVFNQFFAYLVKKLKLEED